MKWTSSGKSMGEHARKTTGEEQRGSDGMHEAVHMVNRLKRTL